MSETTWPPRARRRRPLAVLTAVVTVPALMLAAVWWMTEQRADRGEPTPTTGETTVTPPRAVTPALSLRRVPTTLAVSGALGSFRFQLGAVSSALNTSSCLAVGAHDRRVVSEGSDRSLIPASTMKLLVAAVALDVMEPDRRFVTELRGDIADGVATGPVHLIGGGDPLLAVASYPPTQRHAPEPRTPVELLIERAVASGLTRITEGIVVHDDRYDDERFVPTWGDGIRGTEAGPVGALVINDGFVSGNPVKPSNPAIAAGVEVANLLRAAGVDVTGTVRTPDPADGVVVPDGVLASVESAPLSDVVTEMLTTSDNTTAEMMVKEIAVASGRPGTRIDGLVVVQETLDRWGLPLEGMTLVDGSGLDRGNRLTCDLVLELLQRDERIVALAPALAVAGETGTMTALLRDTPLAGRLLAKTGTLRGVRAFSGYLPAAGGVDLVYTLIVNGDEAASCGVSSCPQLEMLARALATYPGATPTPASLRPAAARSQG
jgi:D-alanyl-D-alanine carboxypeptidase/D-alanyl-D-alanine-endopeptidase (penicillin-binding protein 4)